MDEQIIVLFPLSSDGYKTVPREFTMGQTGWIRDFLAGWFYQLGLCSHE